MIHFKSVSWKNFLSTGNQFTEIDLNRNETTLIIGENGAGKSTVLDALYYCSLADNMVWSKEKCDYVTR